MRAIIGTAGHIDHGKSALVKALTGIETDRLPQERERGISIELGFAYLDLGDGGRAGIVDVPGHERFVRQMLAGAHGFDLVIVVVAADDGVMPQTEEHFEIVHLLGVRKAVFAITKIDMVDAARVEEVRGELEILAVGTEFEEAPVVPVSALNGQGVEELRGLVVEMLADLGRTERAGPLRVPVDRVFVMKGHGVVVTGTALGGSVAPGDEIVILPGGRQARTRDVQVHGRAVERAWAGERVAMNLVGLGREDVCRGDTVATPGWDLTTGRFDARAEIRPLAGRPVRSHERVRVHLSTREVLGRLVWLDGREEVEPRQSAYCQIALMEPAVVCHGDRFVVRDETAERTLGGGRVLVARAQKHRKSHGPVSERLATLESGGDTERMGAVLDMAPGLGLAPDELALAAGIQRDAVAGLIGSTDEVVAIPDAASPTLLVSRARYQAYVEALLAAVGSFQRDNPARPGIELEHLRASVRPVVDQKVFRPVVEEAVGSGRLGRRASRVFTPEHRVTLDEGDEALARRAMETIDHGGVMPPNLKQLEQDLAADARKVASLVGVLAERGEVVKVAPDLFYSVSELRGIEESLREALRRDGEITAGGFRDLIAASRKYCIPLLDFFDRSGVTIRVGDVRRLRSE